MTITYQEYKDKYKHLQQIQLASRVLDHWENYSLHEIVTHKSGLNDLISGLREFLFFMDTKYSLDLVKFGIKSTERQFLYRLKEVETEYLEYYKVLVKAIQIRNGLDSVITTVYHKTYINAGKLENVLAQLESRLSDMFPERDKLLMDTIRVIAETLANLEYENV